MSFAKAKELREKRANLVAQAKEILDKADSEKRSMTAEETKKFDDFHKEVEELRGTIDRLEKQASAESEMSESRGRRAEESGTRVLSADEAEARAQKHVDAFRAYVLRGEEGMTAEQRAALAEYRAQSVGTAAAGGYLVPQGFQAELEKALKAFGGMREAARILPTASGNDLPWPTVNDTAQVGELVGENVAVSNQDVTFGQVIFKAYKYSTKLIPVSLELLQDSAFNMDEILAPMMGERVARITNTHFTTGTGVSQPKGVIADAVLGKTGAVGQTTSVVYDDLVDLEHSVDRAYRQGAKWMFADSTLKAIKKLKDGQQRPLWLPGLDVHEPDTILGYSYVVNNDVPVMAANAKSILFGAFNKYIIRDVLGLAVRRLDERYAELGQVAFIGFQRADGRMVDAGTHPIAYYANSAT